MNAQKFLTLRDELNAQCEQLLKLKGEDYSDIQNDRLSNFKEVATSLGLSPLQVWGVYFMKHLFAILKFVRTGAIASEPIDGRLQDARNYIDLGFALLEEARHAYEIPTERDRWLASGFNPDDLPAPELPGTDSNPMRGWDGVPSRVPAYRMDDKATDLYDRDDSEDGPF